MKRSAVGVMNGNWRQRWNDELSVPVKRNERKEIYTAIRPFFTDEMWEKFVDAGPDTNADFLAYVKAEWQRIYDEFMVTA